ncbi:MAG: hypothetical protein ACOX21_09360 [Bacillota bacterium]|nr:hypothetical protein [Bacillota bacterium]HOC05739.1 hypothetical protein [Bacillota bacterium]HPZ21436.1 hypothetical protein [Bacillota bacterium]HQD19297.1 hypothetical protein [Bacillota bacterium]
MVTLEVKKELVAKIRLEEVDIEARAVITPQGEVEIVFMPWSQWRMSGSSFDELVEDYNLLKSQIKLCIENLNKEQLKKMQP